MLLNQIFLVEKVIGNIAIGYHRTKSIQKLNGIKDKGLLIGARGMYGPGVYLTYDFEHQQDSYMLEMYGQFIVKCKVNLQNFLIFDEDVAKQVYGINYSLVNQLKLLGAHNPKKVYDDIINFYEKITFENSKKEQYTSDIANAFALLFFRRVIDGVGADVKISFSKNLKGIVFTGRKDGNVIVAYDQQVVVPFAYARVLDLEKKYEEVKWNKLSVIPKTQTNDIGAPISQAVDNVYKILVKYMRSKNYQIEKIDRKIEFVGRGMTNENGFDFYKSFDNLDLSIAITNRTNDNIMTININVCKKRKDNSHAVENVVSHLKTFVFEYSELLKEFIPQISEFENKTKELLTIKERYIEYVFSMLKILTTETPEVSYFPVNGNIRQISTNNIIVKPYNIYNSFSAQVHIKPFDNSIKGFITSFGGAYGESSLPDTYERMFSMIDPQEIRFLKIYKKQNNEEISNSFTPKFKNDLEKLLN
jgi:hypothetical protein